MLFVASGWFPSAAFNQIFGIVLAGWLVSEVLNAVFSLIVLRHGERRDRGSYLIVYAAIVFAILGSYFLRAASLFVLPTILQYIGILLMGSGVFIREWAIITLGRAFSPTVIIKTDQQLVTRGLYHWLRHPSYTGILLTLAGLPLALGTLPGLILTVVVTWVAFSYRVRVEEQALLSAFGVEYSEYIKRTWKFFPGY